MNYAASKRWGGQHIPEKKDQVDLVEMNLPELAMNLCANFMQNSMDLYRVCQHVDMRTFVNLLVYLCIRYGK